MKRERDYYSEINDALMRYECGKYRTHPFSWITDRIVWCWRFKKISSAQKDELCERATAAAALMLLYD